MTEDSRPLVISAPEPRTLDLIFTEEALSRLHRTYRVVEVNAGAVAGRASICARSSTRSVT